MKTLFIILSVVISYYTQAQNQKETGPFSSIQYGVYGGANFESTSDFGGTFIIEFKSSILNQLKMQISAGYTKTTIPGKYNVKTYNKIEGENEVYYAAESYDVLAKEYGIFPISLGMQYTFLKNVISPYALVSVRYNLMDARTVRSPGHVWTYTSFDDVPVEFRTKHIEEFPDNSFSIGLGLGATYTITKALELDFRYFYNIDSEIKNTHNFVIGIIL